MILLTKTQIHLIMTIKNISNFQKSRRSGGEMISYELRVAILRN